MIGLLYKLFLKMLLKDNIQRLYCMQFTGNCPARVLEFSSPIGGRTLVGHVFKTIKITSPDLCEVNCFIEADCVSFNVGPLQDGNHRCELSNSDHRVHPDDLVYGVGTTNTPVVVRIKN